MGEEIEIGRPIRERLKFNKRFFLYVLITILFVAGIYSYYQFFVLKNYDNTIVGYTTKLFSLNETLLSCRSHETELNSSLESCRVDLAQKTTEKTNLTIVSTNLALEKESLSKNMDFLKSNITNYQSEVRKLDIRLNETKIDLEKCENKLLNMTADLQDCQDNLTECLSP